MKSSERLVSSGGVTRGALKFKEPGKTNQILPSKNSDVTPKSSKGISDKTNSVKFINSPVAFASPKKVVSKNNDVNGIQKGVATHNHTSRRLGNTFSGVILKKCPEPGNKSNGFTKFSSSENSIDQVGKNIRIGPIKCSEKTAKKERSTVFHSADSLTTPVKKTEIEVQQQSLGIDCSSPSETRLKQDHLYLNRKIGVLQEKILHRNGTIERYKKDIEYLEKSHAEEIQGYRQRISNLESVQSDLEKSLKSGSNVTERQKLLGMVPGFEVKEKSLFDCESVNMVACMQNKISHIEKSHHSVSEELAATLKELFNAQQCSLELRSENEKLCDENSDLLDTIRQLSNKVKFFATQKDTTAAVHSSSLHLVLPDVTYSDPRYVSSSVDVELPGVKLGEDQMEELQSQVESLRDEKKVLEMINEDLGNQISKLNHALALNNEECDVLRQEMDGLRLRTNLNDVMDDNERIISELSEQKFNAIDSVCVLKSKCGDLNLPQKSSEDAEKNQLDTAGEKDDDIDDVKMQNDLLESEFKECKKNFQNVLNELEVKKLECIDTYNTLKELQNTSRKALKDLQDRLDTVVAENSTISEDLSNIQATYQNEVKENTCLRSVLCSMENEILLWKQKFESLEITLSEEKNIISAEREEWAQFQSDLLLVVRAANDLKTEAEEMSDKLEKENVILRERIRTLEKDTKSFNANGIPHSNLKLNSLSEDQSDSRSTEFINPYSHSPDLEDNRYLSKGTLNKVFNSEDNTFMTESQSDTNKMSDILTSELPSEFNKNLLTVKSSSKDLRRRSFCEIERVDPLTALVKVTGGSKRNALLKWCQNRTTGYKHIDITNFSTSWNDGMALCALLHTFVPHEIPYEKLQPENREENFRIAFKASESIFIETSPDIKEVLSSECPIWEKVMGYVKDIYVRLEGKATNVNI